MNLEQYYENCSKNYRKIIDSLRELDYMISSNDLSKLTGIHFKSIGRYLKVLINDGVIEKQVFSPKGKSKRYSLFYLKGNQKIDGIEHVDLTDITIEIETKDKKDDKTTNIKKPIILNESKINVDTNDLKDEILDEIKKSLANNSVIQASKTEIIKFINKIPIREVDKEALGYEGKTSNEVRSHIIDLLDLMTYFKL